VTPDGFADAADPFMSSLVWKAIDQKTWQQIATGARSHLQRMVGLHMGNGYAMCRTKIGTNKIDAVYVTDNFALQSEDLSRPENLALQRKAQTAVENREMLMIRQPKHAKHILNEYVRTLQAALDTGKAQLALMESSVSVDMNNNGNEDEEDED
jgi:hypothetical protein